LIVSDYKTEFPDFSSEIPAVFLAAPWTDASWSWEAPVRFRVILAAAAFALAGCNANQAINPCGRDPDCNPYDPTSYAQNQTGRGGGGH
jgi:hypothetical protein